ncbi:hypothetical protein Jann_4091 [Jannaschia sp. CCS1]|nr:hypothetical protein Jann_4091 [Jannaschia sp. CCS1]
MHNYAGYEASVVLLQTFEQSAALDKAGSFRPPTATQHSVIPCHGPRLGVGVGGRGGSEGLSWKRQTYPPCALFVLLGTKAVSLVISDR